MNKNKGLLIAVVLLIIFMVILVAYILIKKESNNRLTRETYDYIIETDIKWKTMMDDGGSNTNIYYEIDLKNNSVNKITEIYEANLGGKSKTTKKSNKFKISINFQRDK